jgi:hypothetical protein
MLSVIMQSAKILSVIMLNVIMLSVIMLSVSMLSVIMLSVIMMSDIMLSVIMLSVIMLGVIMLSVIMLFVSMLNVVAPGHDYLIHIGKVRTVKMRKFLLIFVTRWQPNSQLFLLLLCSKIKSLTQEPLKVEEKKRKTLELSIF